MIKKNTKVMLYKRKSEAMNESRYKEKLKILDRKLFYETYANSFAVICIFCLVKAGETISKKKRVSKFLKITVLWHVRLKIISSMLYCREDCLAKMMAM